MNYYFLKTLSQSLKIVVPNHFGTGAYFMEDSFSMEQGQGWEPVTSLCILFPGFVLLDSQKKHTTWLSHICSLQWSLCFFGNLIPLLDRQRSGGDGLRSCLQHSKGSLVHSSLTNRTWSRKCHRVYIFCIRKGDQEMEEERW